MPQVTAKASNGGASSALAQFDLFRARPRVARPSRTLGSKRTSRRHRGVELADRPQERRGVDAVKSRGEFRQRVRLDARRVRLPVLVPQQVSHLRVEHLPGEAARLLQHLAAVPGVGVVPEVGALVEKPLSPRVDDDAEWIAVLLVAVTNLEVADLGRVQIPGHGVAAGPLPGPSGARFEGHADAIARVEAAAPNLGPLPAFAEGGGAASRRSPRSHRWRGTTPSASRILRPDASSTSTPHTAAFLQPQADRPASVARLDSRPLLRRPLQGPPPARGRLPAPAASDRPRNGACRRPRTPDPRRGERTRLPGHASTAASAGSPPPASRPAPGSPDRRRSVRYPR